MHLGFKVFSPILNVLISTLQLSEQLLGSDYLLSWDHAGRDDRVRNFPKTHNFNYEKYNYNRADIKWGGTGGLIMVWVLGFLWMGQLC